MARPSNAALTSTPLGALHETNRFLYETVTHLLRTRINPVNMESAISCRQSNNWPLS